MLQNCYGKSLQRFSSKKRYSQKAIYVGFSLIVEQKYPKANTYILYKRLPTQFRDNFFGFELQNCQEIVLQQGLLMLQGRNFDGLITT